MIDVEIREGVSRELPAWMADEGACAAMSLGSPQVSVDALTELRVILLRCSGSPAISETSDGDGKEPSDETITKDRKRSIHAGSSPRANPATRPTKKEELLNALADLMLEALGAESALNQEQKEGSDESKNHA